MRSFVGALVGLLASSAAAASSSFHADVVRRAQARQNKMRQQRSLNDELLERAIPVDYFEKTYGVSLGRNRRLEDYEMDENDMYSLSGYSLTFAKCQPVQYFSDYAVQMGSYSPMITDDIVILRLCETSSCSNSAEYGCTSNYAEYAIDLEDYMNIVLRYAAQKKEYMCEYCDECLGRRRRLDQNEEENDVEEDQQENEQEEEGEQEEEAEEGEQQEDQEDQAQDDTLDEYYDDGGNDASQQDDYYQYACDSWDTYCSDYSNFCVENENGNKYMDYEEYLDYLECTEVEYNNVRYYIKPRCDGYHNTIKMTLHYDAYCMQTIGNEMSVKNLGLGMRDSAFQDFYSGNCVDCSESDYPPYDATSAMCNLVHYKSAQCMAAFEYNPFDNGSEVDDSTECSYIESIRTGTYDETGTITLRSFGFTSQKITLAQKLFLSLFVLLTVALTVYACYLHHAMTNLLIKSLSHRELLPPSRHASRRNSPRRTGRRLKKVGADSDWDDDGNEFA